MHTAIRKSGKIALALLAVPVVASGYEYMDFDTGWKIEDVRTRFLQEISTVGGTISWWSGTASNALVSDQGGAIELGWQNSTANPVASGTPYMDFHFWVGAGQDYNMRFINSADKRIDVLANGNPTPSLTIKDGSVGVGVAAPVQKLEVGGNLALILSGSSAIYRMMNLAAPVANYDAANKEYVDAKVAAAGGTDAAGVYLNNGEYYSVGGDPYYCKMFKLGDSQQFIKAINYRKPCDITGGKYCNKNAECTTVQDPLIFSPGTVGFTKCIIYGNAVLCSGLGAYGQIGDSTTSNKMSPTKVSFLDKPAFIHTGRSMTCAVEDEGSVKCWGQDRIGLGNGSTQSSYPVKVNSIINAKEVYTNNNFNPRYSSDAADSWQHNYDNTCALLKDGGVKCWGMGTYGINGNGVTSNQTSPVTANLGGTGTKLYPSNYYYDSYGNSPNPYWEMGYPYWCTIMSDQSVKCWGSNNKGQLGDGTTTDKSTPGNVKTNSITNLTGVQDLALTNNHGCALKTDGSVWCWGNNYDGQLGNGTNTASSYAVQVKINSTTTLGNIKQIVSVPNWQNTHYYAYSNWWPSYGIHFTTCALTNTGYVYCWGDGDNGLIGDANATDRTYATQVTNIYGATKITWAIGWNDNYGSNMCALISEGGKVKCWGGYNYAGVIGDGSQNAWKYSPVTVSNLDGATDIFGGKWSTCAVINSEFRCWGYNSYGQLGVGNTSNQFTPSTVKNLPDNFAIYGSDAAEKTMGASGGTPVFCVTRNKFNGNLGGVEGANAICQSECGAGYKFGDLGDMANFPGMYNSDNPWTQGSSNHCNNWADASNSYHGGYLYSPSAWTWWVFESTSYCSSTRKVACVRGVR